MKWLLRVVCLLQSFTPNEPELGTLDIARKVGISKSTAYRILKVLVQAGMLERNPMNRKYRIGPDLYLLGSLYPSATDITAAAGPVFETLNNLTDEASNMNIFDRGNVIVIMRKEAKYPFRISIHTGTIIPAYTSATGKAFLSELTEKEIDSLYPEERLKPLTKETITSKTELKSELEQIRKVGVSFDRQGSFEGVVGIASLVRNKTGKPVAAIALTVPIFRMNGARGERLATLVRLGAGLVSYRLGYQDKDNPVRNIQELRSWWGKNSLDLASKANGVTPDGTN